MENLTYTFWKAADGKYLGYLQNYPDYMTEGDTQEELVENLRDIASDIFGGLVPAVHQTGQLAYA